MTEPAQARDPAAALPPAPVTGDAGVDAALAPLLALTEDGARVVHDHVAVVEAVHRALQDRLAAADG